MNAPLPTQDTLAAAKRLADRIRVLKTELSENPPLLNQAKLHEENLEKCHRYLEDRTHQVAFIGSVGVGKTTAICHLLGLIDEAGVPLLSTSSGRTTLCEVAVTHGTAPKILIDPLSQSEVEDYLVDFVGMIEQRSGYSTSQEGEQPPLSSEVERCLRNMLGLPIRREKNPDGTFNKRDLAQERLSELGDIGAFVDESLKTLRMEERSTCELSPDDSEGHPKWLKETFALINQGKHPLVPMPRRMVIEWPYLRFEKGEIAVTVVDTKGLDANVEREDIDRQLQCERTVCVACSRFNDAPEQNVQALFSHMQSIGLKDQLINKTLLLVLPRGEEAANVLAEDGPIDDLDEGKAIRRDQIEDTLRISLRLSPSECPSIHFFGFEHDDPSGFSAILVQEIAKLRQQRIDDIEEISHAVMELETNREAAQAKAAFATVSHAIAAWSDKSRSALASVHHLYKPLVDDINTKEVYASSIRASVNRKGDWHNFDFYYKLAIAARKKVVTSFHQSVAEIESVLENQERQPTLVPAHPFIRQLLRTVKSRVERINERASEMARITFEPPLKDDQSFWTDQRSQWGMGPGYKTRIAEQTERWFNQHDAASKEQSIQEAISRSWKDLVDEIEALLAKRS